MQSFRIMASALALSVAMPFAAHATVINFDTLPAGGTVADGTLIGTQYASLGVTFTATTSAGSAALPVATSYAAGNAVPGIYSGNYLGNSSNGAPGNPRYDIVSILFAGTASGVSLSLNNFSLVGRTTFNAYNSAGTLIETFTTVAGNGWDTRALASSGIARLDLLNNEFNGSRTFYGIDNLTYTLAATPAVPEPATWAMMIVGFGMTGASMRYRVRAARPASA